MKLVVSLLLAALLGVAGQSHGVPLASIDVGDSYYLRKGMDEPLVTVVSVNAGARRVKVMYANGAVDWVDPSDLITQGEKDRENDAFNAELAKTFLCALDGSNPACKEKPWRPGSSHPRFAHVIAASEKNVWQPEAGYDWVTSDKLGPAAWSPGNRHPQYDHVIAATKEGHWLPSPGYRWLNPPGLGPVVWVPGTTHPRYAAINASDKERQWNPAAGYRWANPSDPANFSVVPAVGFRWVNPGDPADFAVVPR